MSLIKNLLIQQPSDIVEYLQHIDTFPELNALKGVDHTYPDKHKDNYLHTLKVVENTYYVTSNINIRLASILHDIGKAKTKAYIEGIGWSFHNHEFIGHEMLPAIFERFEITNLEYDIDLIKNIVLNHGYPKEFGKRGEIIVSDSALRRFDKSVLDLDALILFCKCDLTTSDSAKLKRQSDFYEKVYQKILDIRRLDKESEWRCVITGNDIINYHNVSGKDVGKIKNIIETAIKKGEIQNEYEIAYEYMKNIKL